MRHHLLTLALLVPVAACSKITGAVEEAGVTDASSLAASAAPTSSAKPDPPPDPDKACVVTPTKLIKNRDGDGSRVGYKMKNNSTRALSFCQVNIFAYDKAGNLLGQGATSDNFTLEGGAEREATYGIDVKDKSGKSVSETPGAGFEAIVSSAIWKDKAEWSDKNFYSDKHEKPKGTPVTFSEGGATAGSASAKGAAPKASAAAKPAAKK